MCFSHLIHSFNVHPFAPFASVSRTKVSFLPSTLKFSEHKGPQPMIERVLYPKIQPPRFPVHPFPNYFIYYGPPSRSISANSINTLKISLSSHLFVSVTRFKSETIIKRQRGRNESLEIFPLICVPLLFVCAENEFGDR